MQYIVGLIGKKGSGKTTVSDFFTKNHNFIRDSFARPIKEASKIIFGFTDAQVYGDLKETVDPRYGFAPRKILQILGTEWCQTDLSKRFPDFHDRIGRTLWVESLIARVDFNKNYIIDDVRFPHEIYRMREACSDNAVVFRTIRIIRNYNEQQDGHASEMEQDSIHSDYTLDNNGTLEQTYDYLDSIAKDILLQTK